MCKKKEYTSMFKSLSLKSKKVGYNTLTHRSYLIQDGIAFNNDSHILHVLSHINPWVYPNVISLHTFSSFFLLYLSFFKFSIFVSNFFIFDYSFQTLLSICKTHLFIIAAYFFYANYISICHQSMLF